jgi:hypothetical protein
MYDTVSLNNLNQTKSNFFSLIEIIDANSTAKEYIKNIYDSEISDKLTSTNISPIKTTTISGKTAYYFEKTNSEIQKEIFVNLDEKTVLRFNVSVSDPLVDQILSTFKFTVSPTIPTAISSLFTAINTNFKLHLIPIAESQFYSPTGMITMKSWKLDFADTTIEKSLTTFLLTKLQPNNQGGDRGGASITGYENNQIICFHSYGASSGDPTDWTNPYNYLSCAIK